MAMRTSIRTLAAAALLLTWAAGANAADEFPARPLTFIVSFSAGGVADTAARLVAASLQQRLGQSVIVENRPGAGGDVAAGVVARAAPDGYTVLFTTTAFAVNLSMQKSKQFSAGDFRTVAFVASSPEALAVNANSPIHTLSDLVNAAKAKPINFGTAGVGTSPHMMAEYFFKNVAKVPAVHIPYQGGAPATSALLGNQIDVLSAIVGGGVASQIKSGKLRGIALADTKRTPTLPDIPTFAESGYQGMTFVDWVGVFAPAKTPTDVIAKLNKEIGAVLKEPAIISKLESLGFAPMSGGPAEAQKEFDSDLAKWKHLVTSLDLTLK